MGGLQEPVVDTFIGVRRGGGEEDHQLLGGSQVSALVLMVVYCENYT